MVEANTARRTGIVYPDGRTVELGYGAPGSTEDSLGLVKSIGIAGDTGRQVEYRRVGAGRFVEIAYPQPGIRWNMTASTGWRRRSLFRATTSF